MKKISRLTILILTLIPLNLIGQEKFTKTPHPKFEPFVGEVYEMPKMRIEMDGYISVRIQEHYGENIYDYPKIGRIGLKKLNIPERSIHEYDFPGVQKKVKFAMLLKSKMDIQLDGCYEFRLSSDDGSKLWVNDSLVVDNDGGHQMQMEKDSIFLAKGNYAVKVWYFQGMPDRFGLILDAKLIGKPATCPSFELPQKDKKMEKLSIQSNVLFEIGKHQLKPTAIEAIRQIAAKISNSKKEATITIIGHTDNTGSDAFNQTLAYKRAEAVMKQLKNFTKNYPALKFTAKGRGSTEPIADNKTAEGRTKNRRVEIIIMP